MDIVELQKAIGADADGILGAASRKALLDAFTSAGPAAVTLAEERAFAARLSVGVRQLQAVAMVESSGDGFDRQGRPKILFERHRFHQRTGGKWSVRSFSNPAPGGYDDSSWDKLLDAIAVGAVDAAFMACSWGKFQVLGQYWADFGYSSPLALARSTVASEAGHYELLCRFVECNRLAARMRAISADPDTCRAFARAYNGPSYATFGYHDKLARAMA